MVRVLATAQELELFAEKRPYSGEIGYVDGDASFANVPIRRDIDQRHSHLGAGTPSRDLEQD